MVDRGNDPQQYVLTSQILYGHVVATNWMHMLKDTNLVLCS